MPPAHDSVIWPHREGLGKVLGDLELFVMELVWKWPSPYPVTVKEVHQAAQVSRPLAYTSVLSTMTNLVKKEALRVEKEHFAHRYWPTSTREVFEQEMLSRLMGSLVKDFTAPALQHFVGTLETVDPRLLDALDAEIQRRRRQETP
ncbi:Transcriptional regulator BlaI [compost metagenome]